MVVCMCAPVKAREKAGKRKSEWVFCMAVGWWRWGTSPISQAGFVSVEPYSNC